MPSCPQFFLPSLLSVQTKKLSFNTLSFLVLLRCRGEFQKMVSSRTDIPKATTTYWGWWLIGIGLVSFVGFLFAAVISKLLPSSDNPIISAIQNDRYYCVLVPLTVPILVVAVYFHWLSMKLFKHA
ncbi:uncharacterized protein LOC110641186 [Hevea brasiliensis]|uniref:uncharacterized protein LOC110641186 n=1 Tax=Hevea brasiliensis TaxID=3981 RepID=UPI0025D77EB2|nr:uncharacterized protein LOC110641186 [Hevea brasiliensis]